MEGDHEAGRAEGVLGAQFSQALPASQPLHL